MVMDESLRGTLAMFKSSVLQLMSGELLTINARRLMLTRGMKSSTHPGIYQSWTRSNHCCNIFRRILVKVEPKGLSLKHL